MCIYFLKICIIHFFSEAKALYFQFVNLPSKYGFARLPEETPLRNVSSYIYSLNPFNHSDQQKQNSQISNCNSDCSSSSSVHCHRLGRQRYSPLRLIFSNGLHYCGLLCNWYSFSFTFLFHFLHYKHSHSQAPACPFPHCET